MIYYVLYILYVSTIFHIFVHQLQVSVFRSPPQMHHHTPYTSIYTNPQHDPTPPAEFSELHEAIDTNAQRSDGRLGGQNTSVERLPGWTFFGRSGRTDQDLPVIFPKAPLSA